MSFDNAACNQTDCTSAKFMSNLAVLPFPSINGCMSTSPLWRSAAHSMGCRWFFSRFISFTNFFISSGTLSGAGGQRSTYIHMPRRGRRPRNNPLWACRLRILGGVALLLTRKPLRAFSAACCDVSTESLHSQYHHL